MTLPKPPSILLALAVAACASAGGPGAPSTPDAGEVAAPSSPSSEVSASTPAIAPTAGSAVFSDAQADRGRGVFRSLCTECHYSSEFSDAQFKFKWSRRAAGDLYEVISTTMPEAAPGSLTDNESVDLVSYILRMNGFEPGTTELPADRAVLDGIALRSIRDN